LHLVGGRCTPISSDKGRFHQMEIEYGTFERVINIPLMFGPNHIEAYYENSFSLFEYSEESRMIQ